MLPLPPAVAHCVPGNPQRFASAPMSVAWAHRTTRTAAVRAQSSAAHRCAGLIRVQTSAVHGTGVFACRDIAQGELVLDERPLVCCETLRAARSRAADPDSDQSNSSGAQKRKRSGAASGLWQQWADQLLAFARLDWISRGILLSLWSLPTGSADAGDLNLRGFTAWLAEQRPALLRVLPAAICARVVMIFWCNAFEWGQHHHAILPLADRINHSCTPNVVHDSGSQRVTSSHHRSVRFYAAQDIGADTELFIDYLGLQLWGGRVRRERLATTKFFTCRCRLCSDSNSAQQARSDEERAITMAENLRSQLERRAAGRSAELAEQASAQRARIEALVGSEHWAAQQASLCLIRAVAAACCTGEQSSALAKSLAEDLGREVGSLWHWLEHSRKVMISPVWYIGASTVLAVAHALQQQLSQTQEAIALLKKALAAMPRESSQYKELALALVVVRAAARAKKAP